MVLRCSNPLLPLPLSIQNSRTQALGGLCYKSHCIGLKFGDTRQRIRKEEHQIGRPFRCRNDKKSVQAFGLQLWSSCTNFELGGHIRGSPKLGPGRNQIWSTDQNLGGRMSPQAALCSGSTGNSGGDSEVGDRVGSGPSSNDGSSPSKSVNVAGLELSTGGKSEREGSSYEGGFGDENRTSSTSKADARAPSSQHRVAVIGAGAAGLVAARELVREGHQVVVFEQGEEVGGVWQYDPRVESDPLGIDPHRTRVHSSMYHSLRTNLPREIMGYLDYPFVPKQGEEGRDARRFPDHREVAKYLEDFSEDYNLRGLVKFGVQVDWVDRQQALHEPPETRWAVRFHKCGEEGEPETEVFGAVVICNGHYADPRLPEIPGTRIPAWLVEAWAGVESWPGEQVHSHNYRFPHPFQDKVVVVVGSGNSAQDITTEVGTLAKEVHQCARAWTSLEPSAEGKGPQHNIWQHPMVAKACPDGTLEFQDETSVAADIILYCTGYLFSFPFLDTKGYISVEDNRVSPLYKHVFPPALAPELSFVGLPWKVVPFPLMELQSRWIARLLSGKSSLPTESEMTSDIKTLYEQLDSTSFPNSYTHNCGPYQFEYVNWLAKQSGHEPVETWRREIYLSCSRNKVAHPSTYRDEVEDQHWVDVAMASLAKFRIP